MPNTTDGPALCTFQGCTKPPKRRRGLCTGHVYQRQHGKPLTPLRPRRANGAPPEPCAVDGCTKTPKRNRRRCSMHTARINRHGDPAVCKPNSTRKPDPAYRSVHSRLASDRGPARQYPCVDCGDQAQHWSYDHTDPAELRSPGGQPYSLDPQRYKPRCVRCHIAFDRAA